MILTPHLLVGAVVASKISNPILALPLALLSHYFLDPLAQKEYQIENIKAKNWSRSFFDFSKVFLDISCGVVLIALFSEKNPVIFIGAFLAIIPDGLTLVNIIFPNNKLIKLHQRFHEAVNSIYYNKIKREPPFLGILAQITVVAAAIFLLR